jgi:amino acid transporter
MGAGFAIGRSLFGPDGIPIWWLLVGGVTLFAALKMYQAFRFYRSMKGYYTTAKEAINQPRQVIINVVP